MHDPDKRKLHLKVSQALESVAFGFGNKVAVKKQFPTERFARPLWVG